MPRGLIYVIHIGPPNPVIADSMSNRRTKRSNVNYSDRSGAVLKSQYTCDIGKVYLPVPNRRDARKVTAE